MRYHTPCMLAALLAAGCGGGPPADLAALDPGREVALFNGRDPAGWRVLDGAPFFAGAGAVTVDEGILAIGAGQPLTGIGWEGTVPRDGYEIRLTARRARGDDFFCGLTFPVGSGHATLILGGWSGTTVGISDIDGFSANRNRTTQQITFVNGRWYAIRLRVAEGMITVTLDGRTVIEHGIEDHAFEVWPQQAESKPLGITTYFTRGEFREILFRRL